MKHLKMLGLAAAALMALGGAGPASATVLCTVEPIEGSGIKGTVCPANQAYPAGTEIHGSLESGVVGRLTDAEGGLFIECKSTTFAGSTKGEGSATETIAGAVEAKNLTIKECTDPLLGGGACSVTTLKGGTLEMHWIANSFNGTLTSNGSEITSSCNSIFGSIHCIYTTNNTDIQTLTGGSSSTMDVEDVPISQVVTSFLCPEGARWDAKYEITSPKPLYVAAHT